jgi:signal transduction histidine kinase
MTGPNDAPSPSMMEDALRGYLSRRCKRAYAHDMRNGLQGIQAGLDALARAARPNKPSPVPLEQLTQFVQQAITNHERGLERVMESVAPEDLDPAPVKLRELLADLGRFLTTDAARNRVRIKVDMGDDLVADVAPARLRLIFLGLLTTGIDALTSGGDIAITAEPVGAQVQIDFVDPRTGDDADAFVASALTEVVALASGNIERQQTERGYRVRLRLPRHGT